MGYLFYLLFGYLSGSITFGYLIPKFLKGIDVREKSLDHNPGTANAFLHAGITCGVLVLLGDLLKGMIPVYMALKRLDAENIWFSLVLAAPVFGHAYPLFTGLKKGGKAIAVSFGVLLGLCPYGLPVLLLAFYYLFFSLVLVIEPHSYRTVITFFCWALTAVFRLKIPSFLLGAVLIAVIVIQKHRPELKKVEERQVRFAFRKGDL